MDDPSLGSLLIYADVNLGIVIPLTIVLILLITFSCYFSGTETAFTAVNNVRLKKIAESKKSAKLVLKFTSKYDQVLSCLLVGNNIVNISATTISTILFTELFNADIAPIITTVGLTIVILIFGEITPKMLAKEFPEKFLCLTIYVFVFFYYLFYPLTKIFDLWKILLSKIFKTDKKKPTLTEYEFKMIVTDIKDEGVLNDNEHDLIQKSIIFDDTLVQKIMTPKEKVVVINERMNNIEIKNLFEENNYSRVPYLSEDGMVLGAIYQKDFYEMLLEKNCEIEDIVKPVIFVRPDDKISLLFRLLQKKKQHLAIVHDYKTNTNIGIVTMEDIIEELVGEIEDEYDAEDAQKESINNFTTSKK